MASPSTYPPGKQSVQTLNQIRSCECELKVRSHNVERTSVVAAKAMGCRASNAAVVPIRAPLPKGGSAPLLDTTSAIRHMQAANFDEFLQCTQALPDELIDVCIQGLNREDLESLSEDIQTNNAIKEPLTRKIVRPVSEAIEQVQDRERLNLILAQHPEWRAAIDRWQIPLADKVWLAGLLELHSLLKGIVPAITALVPMERNQLMHIPDLSVLEPLLKGKESIQKSLNEIMLLDLSNKSLSRCPLSLFLLPNLQTLNLQYNNLTVPPDVTRNPALKQLILNNNQLTTPPDVTRNPLLQRLIISNNLLTVAPDVTFNPSLQELRLSYNQLTISPDLTLNPALQILTLSYNQLIYPPSIAGNPELQHLYLDNNQIRFAPDIAHNPKLKLLHLHKNPFRVPPSTLHNPYLEVLKLPTD